MIRTNVQIEEAGRHNGPWSESEMCKWDIHNSANNNKCLWARGESTIHHQQWPKWIGRHTATSGKYDSGISAFCIAMWVGCMAVVRVADATKTATFVINSTLFRFASDHSIETGLVFTTQRHIEATVGILFRWYEVRVHVRGARQLQMWNEKESHQLIWTNCAMKAIQLQKTMYLCSRLASYLDSSGKRGSGSFELARVSSKSALLHWTALFSPSMLSAIGSKNAFGQLNVGSLLTSASFCDIKCNVVSSERQFCRNRSN